ncbi:MAG: prephenate/arogenate dehydrogenase family protein [Alphaproteobacteria bacterium]|nr:prephenate/arogenate dehydrogenase family protein [Alphaproteobacteria bacterium]
MFDRVAFIGIGLIGSSLARVMRRDSLAGHIVACARTQATLDTALALGLADTASTSVAEAVKGADLVVIASPMSTYRAIAAAMAPALMPGAIVTDVGSVKGSAVADVTPLLPAGVHFVPGHPVAGTEHSGPEAGFDTLFRGRWCILTPEAATDAGAVERVAELWRRAGAMIEVMDWRHHDMVLAITSHLPHLIAYNIVGTVADLEQETQREVIKFAASGFRDFTRIAASDPVMWRDVFLTNREAVLQMLQRFTEDLSRLQRAIRRGEADELQDLFTRTRAVRRGIIDAGQA